MLQEQINHRMHKSSRYNRKTTYSFILLTVQHLAKTETSAHTKRLYKNIQKHWEHLPFLFDESHTTNAKIKNLNFGTQLAFWLEKPYIIAEIIDELLEIKPLPKETLFNALMELTVLRSYSLLKDVLVKIKSADKSLNTLFELYHNSITQFEEKELKFKTDMEQKLGLALLESAYDEQQFELVEAIGSALPQSATRDTFLLYTFFRKKQEDKVLSLLSKYPLRN